MATMNKKTKNALIGTAIFVVVCLALVLICVTTNPPIEITYEQFKQDLQAGNYERVYLGIYDVRCTGTDGNRYAFTITDRKEFDTYVTKTITNLGLDTIYTLGEPIKDK